MNKIAFLLIVFAVISSFHLAAQTNSNLNELSIEGGYKFKQSSGETEDGLSVNLTYDHYLKLEKSIFLGVDIGYYQSSLGNILIDQPQSIDADLLSSCFRCGIAYPFNEKLRIKGFLEGGVGFIQSRETYDGTHYRTPNSTAIFGIGATLLYRINTKLGLTLTYKMLRYGNDDIWHGSKAVSTKPLVIEPVVVSIGVCF